MFVDSFEKFDLAKKDKLIIQLLEEMNEHLERIERLLERQGSISPS